MSDKPKWKHSISVELFKKISSVSVTSISKKDVMTSVDTSDRYTVLHYGRRKIETKKDISDYFEASLAPYQSVIKLTSAGERARDDLNEIKKWETKHARELAEYKRLKNKFEGGKKSEGVK